MAEAILMESDSIRALSRTDKVVSSVGRHVAPCGYCRSESNTSVTCGMYAHRITVDIYQNLLDCGWRRSGCWLYRPIPDETCCNPYTIRLDVHKFQPDKVLPALRAKGGLPMLLPCPSALEPAH